MFGIPIIIHIIIIIVLIQNSLPSKAELPMHDIWEINEKFSTTEK